MISCFREVQCTWRSLLVSVSHAAFPMTCTNFCLMFYFIGLIVGSTSQSTCTSIALKCEVQRNSGNVCAPFSGSTRCSRNMNTMICVCRHHMCRNHTHIACCGIVFQQAVC